MLYVDNQVFSPYGSQRYQSGSMPTYTMKGFTGQYADTVTGLDYYNARYYDPAAGVFLSADTQQGNTVGMNPYGYVGGNPETDTDPTGKYYAPPGGPGGPGPTPPPPCNQSNNFCGTGNGNNPGGPPQKQPSTPPASNPTKDKQGCQNILCDIKDPGKFWRGIGEVAFGLAILTGAIISLTNAEAEGWGAFLLSLAKAAIQKGGYLVLQILKNGLQSIVPSLYSINPWVQVALDVVQDIADVAVLVATGIDVKSLIEPRRGGSFLQKLGTVVTNVAVGNTKGIYGTVRDGLATDLLNFGATGFQLSDDIETTLNDIQAAQAS